MCSTFELDMTGVSRNEIWTNDTKKESIERIDQFYIDAGMPKPAFDGLLFEIQSDDPFAIDRIFRQLQKKYTTAKYYRSDANIILCDTETVYSEYLSIFMNEDDKDDEY